MSSTTPFAVGYDASSPAAPPTRRPARLAYVPALLVAVVGVLVATVWIVAGVLDQVQRPPEFSRADLPGTVAVTLTQTGTHVVYVEADRAGTPDLIGQIRTDQIIVTGPSGEVLPVRSYGSELRYDAPDNLVGTAVGVFDNARTGTFTVATTAQDVQGLPDARLAVGDDLAPGVVRAIGLPALTALFSVVAGVVLAVLTSRRRAGMPVVSR